MPERVAGAGREAESHSLAESIAAGIAHEVRDPLNALQILGILEQELSEIVPDRSGHVFEVIAKIARELRSLDAFVTEFLRFARPPRLSLETVAVRPLLADLTSPAMPSRRSSRRCASATGSAPAPTACGSSTIRPGSTQPDSDLASSRCPDARERVFARR